MKPRPIIIGQSYKLRGCPGLVRVVASFSGQRISFKSLDRFIVITDEGREVYGVRKTELKNL